MPTTCTAIPGVIPISKSRSDVASSPRTAATRADEPTGMESRDMGMGGGKVFGVPQELILVLNSVF